MFAALITVALVAPAESPKEKQKELPKATKKELASLAGKWKLTKAVNSTTDGEVAPKPNDPDMVFVFKGDELTMEFGDKKETVKIGAIDPKTDPKCIDLIEARRDQTERTLEGVYKIDKDTLRIALCVPKEGKQRPAGFDKPTDPRTMVWTLTRVKE